MDLFNKKKLKETKEWLNEIIQDRNKWEQAYINQVKDTNNLLEENKSLSKTNDNLMQENKKLIDWIEKIINEVGVKINDSYENQTITIPYYEKTKPYKASGNEWKELNRKDIIIPSIRYTKIR